MTKKYESIFLQVMFVLLVNKSIGLCPEQCICDIWNDLKRTSCVGRNLISIDNNIPKKSEAVDLSSNFIITVPDYGFKELTSLQYLNLSSNHMGYLSLRSFDGLIKLTTLDLSYNNLQGIIPEMFKSNMHLRSLILTGNQFFVMDTYPTIVSDSIEVLLMNKCLISYIYEENLQGLKNLTHLDLSDNLLTMFKATNIYENSNLKYVNLNNNDIKCKENLMLNFQLHCYVYKIDCKTDCSLEKSQKIMMGETKTTTTTTEATYTPWDVKDFDDETVEPTKETKQVETYYTMDECQIIIPVIIAFFSGLAVGMINVGLCVCVIMSSRNHRRRKRNQLIQESEVRWSLNSNIPHIRFINNT